MANPPPAAAAAAENRLVRVKLTPGRGVSLVNTAARKAFFMSKAIDTRRKIPVLMATQPGLPKGLGAALTAALQRQDVGRVWYKLPFDMGAILYNHKATKRERRGAWVFELEIPSHVERIFYKSDQWEYEWGGAPAKKN